MAFLYIDIPQIIIKLILKMCLNIFFIKKTQFIKEDR